jgi:peptide/nickel transport system permease protein
VLPIRETDAMNRLLAQLARMALIVVAAVFICALLVRYAPGALVDERELDPHLSEESLAALRAEKGRDASVGANFIRYLRGAIHGDLGYSESNRAPIAALIADRAPETLRELAIGLGGAWLIGFAAAIPAGRWRNAHLYDGLSSAAAALLLSVPAAVAAYVCLLAGLTSAVVLMIAVAPKIFRFARNLIVPAYGAPHVFMARARGLSESRILFAHVLPPTAPQLLALAAASASMAIGAAIPIEAICEVPGLGRLAWQAALARDLPLLVNVTMLVALATTVVMTLAGARPWGEERKPEAAR